MQEVFAAASDYTSLLFEKQGASVSISEQSMKSCLHVCKNRSQGNKRCVLRSAMMFGALFLAPSGEHRAP